MQTQQVYAFSGHRYFGSATTASADKTVDAGFETMFQASTKKYESTDVTPEKNAEATKPKTKEASKEDITANAAGKDKTSDTATKVQDVDKTEQAGNAEQTKGTDDTELAERAAALMTQVTVIVKDVLGISEEQLQEAMQLLGITEADLCNTDVLKQLLLTVNKEQDSAAFLVNADLLKQMQQLTEAVDKAVKESGLDLNALAEKMTDAEFSELFDAAMQQLTEDAAGDANHLTEAKKAPEETKQTETKETEITFKNEGVATEKAVAHENRNADREFSNQENPFAEQFLQNLQKAVTNKADGMSLQTDLAAQIREIAEQILEKVRVMVTPDTTSLEIQLTPEHLGKVNLTVTEQNGMMKATFVTENEIAKEAIESNLVQFKEMLQEQGIKVESIEVTVSDFTFDKNNQAGQSEQEEKKKNRQHMIFDDDTENTTQDSLALHFMEDGESTVNYMA